MAYELEKEFIEANNLSEEVVGKINGIFTAEETKLTEDFSGKANKDAEQIISGAVTKVVETTGIARNDGEKAADYLGRASGLYVEGKLSSKTKEIEKLEKDLQEKLKNGSGDAELKASYDALVREKEQWEGALTDKDKVVQEKEQELSAYKISSAFRTNKPVFAKEVNEYEAKAKWDGFVKEVKETRIIKLDEDGEAWAHEKEADGTANTYKRVKLSELIANSESLKPLTTGRTVNGSGTTTTDKTVNVDGLPFQVKEGGGTKEFMEGARKYLSEQKIAVTSPEYSKKFSEFTKKFREHQNK
jgi:hypothetical protein